jgi:hypothetical protein
VDATRKKSWRLDGQKPDRQRDWLGVSFVKYSTIKLNETPAGEVEALATRLSPTILGTQ